MKASFIPALALLGLFLIQLSHAVLQLCPTQVPATGENHNSNKCGPITTKVGFPGGTLASCNIPANPTYGASAINAAQALSLATLRVAE